MGRWRPSWWTSFADDHPRTATVLARLRTYLPPLNFITIHYAYFIVVSLVTSVIFWGSSSPARSIPYVDSLFLTVSAMSEAGLNTVNLSEMTTWQQILLWLLIIFGGTIWVSIWTVAARLHVFEQRFEAIVRQERERERERRLQRPGSSFGLPLLSRISTLRKAATTPPVDQKLPATGTRLNATGVAIQADIALGPLGLPPPGPRRTESLPALVAEEQANGELPTRTEIIMTSAGGELSRASDGHIAFAENTHRNAGIGTDAPSAAISSAYSPEGNYPVRRNRNGNSYEPASQEKNDSNNWHMHNFLTNKTVGRNAQFHGLTSEEREELGGCEYRALKVLLVIVSVYFVSWQLLGCIGLAAWMANNQPETARANGINPWWLGIFNGASAFNNSGMSLLDANMIPFENARYVLITMGLMILAGNTAYPIFLRLIMWSMLKLLRLTTPEDTFSEFKVTIEFILKYPRRVYTNLFPSRQTWWLLFMLVWLNCTDWVSFELLNFGNTVIESISPGSRVLDGLFQALAVRSGGFYVVPISSLYIGLQVLYVIMMYISVYPVVITMRHSNVYEERSLGIYAHDRDTADDVESGNHPEYDLPDTEGPDRPPLVRRLSRSGAALEMGRALHRTLTPWHGVGVPSRTRRDGGQNESRISFISQQIHGQLAHDIWWLVLAVLVITTIETSHFLSDPVTFSVFNVIFEVVSAYGCVGISVGLPNEAYSFSGGWHWPSKLVLCLVMIRGRHRGLPVALDRAVRLPGEELHREEEEDHRIRRSMTSRRMSIGD